MCSQYRPRLLQYAAKRTPPPFSLSISRVNPIYHEVQLPVKFHRLAAPNQLEFSFSSCPVPPWFRPVIYSSTPSSLHEERHSFIFNIYNLFRIMKVLWICKFMASHTTNSKNQAQIFSLSLNRKLTSFLLSFSTNHRNTIDVVSKYLSNQTASHLPHFISLCWAPGLACLSPENLEETGHGELYSISPKSISFFLSSITPFFFFSSIS